MKKFFEFFNLRHLLVFAIVMYSFSACQKDGVKPAKQSDDNGKAAAIQKETEIQREVDQAKLDNMRDFKSVVPKYDLNVILFGDHNIGLLKFRQDPDPAKIVDLDVWVIKLQPNHEYLFQRAVDAANVVDGECTSTGWLTLGKGLVPQSIVTDSWGIGHAELWRDVSAVPSETAFDIHFQVIDAVTLEVVQTSGCYQYKVR
jgi:hypothetical protein